MESELTKVAAMPLVAQAYLNPDAQTIVVELRIVPRLGLKYENLLFFPSESFSAEKVSQALAKLRKKLMSAAASR